jgi:hypothetical protein
MSKHERDAQRSKSWCHIARDGENKATKVYLISINASIQATQCPHMDQPRDASLALATEIKSSGSQNVLSGGNPKHCRCSVLMCIDEFSCRVDTVADTRDESLILAQSEELDQLRLW